MIQPFSRTGKKLPGHEYISAEEEGIISEMVQELKDQLTRLYPRQKMLRQIHTKMHGCVQGSFTVEPGLPSELQAGVFKSGMSYPVWIRFSNANTTPQPDKKKDIRGVAIKLMNVQGDKILNDQSQADTQDFLLMSSETFFAQNLVHFRRLLKTASAKSKAGLLLFALNPAHWKMLSRIMKLNVACRNPLEIPYWSTQPYQFGSESRAVKYFLQPSLENKLSFTDLSDDNYLRLNMAKTLSENEVGFDFFIQLQTDADKMPIEDPTVPWTSPFIKLAHLNIPVQTFNTPEQMEYGDNLSFNPWHSLPAHRPLGSFNRARKRVYEELSKFRHERNGLSVAEPVPAKTGLETAESMTQQMEQRQTGQIG